jgi:general secretion pathway protein M
MEGLRKLRANLEAWFSQLAPRERVMVASAGAAVLAFIVFVAFMKLQGNISTSEEAISRKTQVLSQVGKLAQVYRQSQAERTQLETKLKGPPLQLMSFVSQTGQKLGIEVTDLRPTTSLSENAGAGKDKGGDKVVEDAVEVNLARLDFPKLTTFMVNLEHGPGIVKIRRLAIRSRNDDPNAVDVTIVVATYQLKS